MEALLLEIILLKDVKGVGNSGELKNVSDGFALNYLIPKGLAESATVDKLALVDNNNRKKIINNAYRHR